MVATSDTYRYNYFLVDGLKKSKFIIDNKILQSDNEFNRNKV